MSDKPEPKFVPGEQVIILNSVTIPDAIGSTTEIISVLWAAAWVGGSCSGWAYKTSHNISAPLLAWHENQLGKLPPNTPSTFADCIFKPEKVAA